jgi:hypothetical protein
MGRLNALFAQHGAAYLQRFAATMPAVHQKTLGALTACRTPSAGLLLCACPDCERSRLVPRSCGNRHCPSCQGAKAFAWLQRQCTRALPTHHFMITFTVPAALRAFLRSHQRPGYEALFAASSAALKTLAANPRYGLGDTPGFFGVLHTWGRTLEYHPHIHYVVPGGALDSDDARWHPASPGFFLPVRALSILYRAKFRDAMDRAGLFGQIDPSVWSVAWNVHCQPVADAHNALAYLSRYVFKVAIGNERILELDHTHVRFAYTDSNSHRRRTMTLTIAEFIRRFLQHVLPTGFMKVRYYGFLSPNFRRPIEEIRTHVEIAYGFDVEPPTVPNSAPPQPLRCEHCGAQMRRIRVISSRPIAVVSRTGHADAAPAFAAGP